MVTDHENNLYITGHFTGIIDFDPGPGKFTITSGSPWTPFVVKFGPCMSKTTSELVVQACNRYSLNDQTYDSSGIYTQTLQNTAGCDSIITIHLTVNSQKTQQSIIICEGEYFYAGGANRLVSGVYLDTLIGSNGCDSIVTTHLTVNQKPMLSLGPDTSICRNTALEIHTGLFSTYLWQDGSTNESFYIHTPGLYWVRVTNSEGCEETDSLLIDGFIDPPTNFLSPLDSICPDQKLELKPLRSFIDYSWSTGAIQQIITIDTPGKYWLDVKSTEGCIGRDSVTVIAKDNCETAIYIPNAFTPNNDGNNDLFRATIFGDVKSFRLQVYDRAGQLIFQTTDPGGAWNGFHKGVLQPSATFVWQCYYQLQNGQPAYRKGTVTLLR